jgi:hypothetical protein
LQQTVFWLSPVTAVPDFLRRAWLLTADGIIFLLLRIMLTVFVLLIVNYWSKLWSALEAVWSFVWNLM